MKRDDDGDAFLLYGEVAEHLKATLPGLGFHLASESVEAPGGDCAIVFTLGQKAIEFRWSQAESAFALRLSPEYSETAATWSVVRREQMPSKPWERSLHNRVGQEFCGLVDAKAKEWTGQESRPGGDGITAVMHQQSVPDVKREPPAKVPCKTCGKLIRPRIARKNNGQCVPCHWVQLFAEDEFVRRNRRDVNPYEGITDPVEVLKIMHRPVKYDRLVNLLPYPRKAEELYAGLNAAQAKALVTHAVDVLRSGDRETARSIARCLSALTQVQLDPVLEPLVAELKQALASISALRNRDAICDSCGMYSHVRILEIRAKVHMRGIDVLMERILIPSPGLTWGGGEDNRKTINWHLPWFMDPILHPWWLGCWYGPDGMSLFFHDALVKAALAVAGTFAAEQTPKNVYDAIAGLLDAYQMNPDAHEAELLNHLDPAKLPALIDGHLDRGRSCSRYRKAIIELLARSPKMQRSGGLDGGPGTVAPPLEQSARRPWWKFWAGRV